MTKGIFHYLELVLFTLFIAVTGAYIEQQRVLEVEQQAFAAFCATSPDLDLDETTLLLMGYSSKENFCTAASLENKKQMGKRVGYPLGF